VSTDRYVKAARDDVGGLAMRMLMEGANRPGFELHADHHEIGPVSEHLAANALTGHFPCGVDTTDERLRFRHPVAAAIRGEMVDARMISSGSSSWRTAGRSPRRRARMLSTDRAPMTSTGSPYRCRTPAFLAGGDEGI
jgi:hypothetical protein